MKPIIFSGVQPSGIPTIGNYIGAMKSFVELQEDYQAIYSIVNQHAITVPQKPAQLTQMTRQLAALYLAIGIDPDKAIIFVQSDVPAHAQAAWIIQCHLGLGELERMTQFKDKAAKQESISAGLLAYPALMVGDIILYKAQYVPVGDDQRQHLELTRDFVDRFNSRYNHQLIKPEAIYPKAGARIMSLQDPTSKMSKSDKNERGFISLLDPAKNIAKKVKSAVTDSIGEVHNDAENQPAITNLLAIYSALSNQSMDRIAESYQGKGYGTFKSDLADLIISTLDPIQSRYAELVDSTELTDILVHGAKQANEIATQTLTEIENAIGLHY